jgi:hypothetical protein
MTTVKEIDLVGEHEKAKANLAMLENLLQITQEMEKEKVANSKNEAEVKELSTKFNAAKSELEKLKVSLTKEEEEHTLKAAVWKGKNDNLQRILFKAETSSTASSENDDDLEEAVQLAQDNVALFKQKLTIRQLSSAIKAKNPEIESLEAHLSKKQDMQSAMKTQLQKAMEQLAADKQNYRQNVEAQLKSNSLVASLNNQIDRLNNDMLGKEQTIKSQVIKITELKSTTKSLLPLSEAGHYIRSRKLEWEKIGTKNQGLVEWGNKASHYGMAVADAALYQDPCPQKRNDPEVYIAIYGLHPDFVWANQDSKLLMDILDWRSGMKDYRVTSYSRPSYESSKFNILSKGFFDSLSVNPQAWGVLPLNKYLRENVTGSKMYMQLKEEHDAALAKHQLYLKNK